MKHASPFTTTLTATISALLVAVGLSACSASGGGDGSDPGDDPDPADSARASEIDALVRGIPGLPAEPPARTEGDPGPAAREGDYQCFTRAVTETRQHEDLVAFAANSESMWPGALLRGDSVASGLFTPIVRPRGPATVSVSLENIDGRRSAVMETPSLSAFREAMAGILSQDVTGATPANIYSEIESVHSENQLAMALGASLSVTGLPAQLAASFDFSDQDIKSRYLVKYIQSYYTVDIDQPRSPSDFFGTDVAVADLRDVMGAGNPPLYVSSVTFGRVILFTFESSYSATELGAALDFVYAGGADVSGDVSVTYRDIVSHSKITAYILGGSGGEAARSLGSYDELIDFIQGGGDYSRESPGAPIAYKLAYLADNEPARMSFTDDYEEKECQRVSQKIQVQLSKIEVLSVGGEIGEGDGLEVFGAIQATGSASPIAVFDRGRDDRIEIKQGQSWPQGGEIVESVVDVEPQAGRVIELGAVLQDRDELLGDELLGDEQVAVPFETGWRRDVSIFLTGGGSQVVVTLTLAPI
ncbi:MAG TPA: thiol-activated cytolysin family protein [Kofleriaceae bacterium]|nr:thiol-activated cytolysin family protein [Kofleriaceae bacterium]